MLNDDHEEDSDEDDDDINDDRKKNHSNQVLHRPGGHSGNKWLENTKHVFIYFRVNH